MSVMKAKMATKLAAVTLTAAFIVGCSSSGTVKDSGDSATVGSGTSTTTTGADTGSQIRTITAENVGQLQSVYYFDFDQSTIRPEGLNDLSLHAQFLAANPNAAARLDGHTDEQGTREYNIALGERRAQAVEQFLLGRGVNRSQLETISYGEEKPSIADTAAKNRRVVIKYTAK